MAAGVAAVLVLWLQGALALDVNMVILIFLIAGIALHGSPVAYGAAMRNAARQTGRHDAAIPVLWRHHGHHVGHRPEPIRYQKHLSLWPMLTPCRSGAISAR